MKRIGVLALAVFAVSASSLGMVSSASAQGLPTANPTNSGNRWDFLFGISVPFFLLTNGNKVECSTMSTGNLSETKSPAAEGEFHLTLKGCVGEVSGIKSKCTGLGDATEGEVLMLGSYQTVYDTGGTELGTAILFTVSSTHFTCAGLFLNVIAGTQVCLLKEPYVAKVEHEMVCEQSAGVQKETYLNDAGTTVTPKLTVAEGESATPGAAWLWKWFFRHLNFGKENVSTVIVMN